WEYGAAAELRDALGASIAHVFRIGVDNSFALFRSEVCNVANCHRDVVAVWRLLKQKPARRLTHSQQRRICHSHRPPLYLQSRQRLKVDVERRLFVEPNVVQRLALEGLATALIALDSDYRNATRSVSNLDAIKQIWNAARLHQIQNAVLRNAAGSAFTVAPYQK